MSLKCLAENVPYQAIRILLFTTNLLLTLIGFLFLSFGLGFLSSREFGYTPKMSGLIINENGEIKNSAFTFLGYPELIIMFSIILIITGLFGTFAIVNKNQATLMLHMILMLLICGSELVFGTLVYVRSEDIFQGIKNDMRNSLQFYDNMEPDNKITSGWDFFQVSGQCCGVVSIDDWSDNLENENKNLNDTANTILCQGRRVPQSCQTHNANSINNATACFQTGCFTVVSEFISQRMVPISLIIMSIFLGQLLALLIAVILFGIQKLRNEAYNYGESRKKLLEN